MSTALSITRFILIILSTVVAGCSIYLLARLQLGIRAETWTVWTPLIVSVLSNILYSCSLNPKNRASTARNAFAFILTVGWFVTPSYRIHMIVQLVGSTRASDSFFSVWNCGAIACTLLMIMDIGGLLSGVLSLLEIGLADQASRGVNTPSSDKTSIFVPGGQQQYIPLQQQQPPVQQQFVQQSYYQPASAQPYYAQTQPPTAATTYPHTY
ncbi:hypothetical protein BGZ97_001637 [Linnemannia gamsii]|jgi:hypothetical protein|uniref:Uncharacterized protein n=1 Tax=Linnemannia gamsii TaxID=64522 RepID=A0A9P6RIY6_9FUNG|nr:hypothetical protein BGZ97_001637 [Linnemannia gamsii]